MKRLALLAVGLFVSGVCQAAGLGAAVTGDTYSIYVPMDLSPSFRLEPVFNYTSDKDSSSAGGDSRYKAWSLGVGGFARQPLGDRVESYWGARAAYFSSKSEFLGSSPGFTSSSSDAHGLVLEPTLGASFLVTDRFSVSLEESLGYARHSGNRFGSDTDGYSFYTSNRILLRLMF